MVLGHVSLPTGPSNFKEMRDFYVAVLKPIGYGVYMEKDGNFCGMGPKRGSPDFWLHCGGEDFTRVDATASPDENLKSRGRSHVAFNAASRRQVDEWYRAAVKAGGIPNGEPGERDYVKGYYAAYVLDPLGNNIEMVHWSPWWLTAINAAPTYGSVVVGAVLGYFAQQYFSG